MLTWQESELGLLLGTMGQTRGRSEGTSSTESRRAHEIDNRGLRSSVESFRHRQQNRTEIIRHWDSNLRHDVGDTSTPLQDGKQLISQDDLDRHRHAHVVHKIPMESQPGAATAFKRGRRIGWSTRSRGSSPGSPAWREARASGRARARCAPARRPAGAR